MLTPLLQPLAAEPARFQLVKVAGLQDLGPVVDYQKAFPVVAKPVKLHPGDDPTQAW